MFKISSDRKTISDIPLITSNFEVIHFDEIPYLYYGTNRYGTKIIGSLLEEDEDTLNLRYVHTLVDNTKFHRFINQLIPYRNLVERGTDVYIVDKNINEKPIAIYSITPDLIPEDYLPVQGYYCPKYNFSIGNDFVISLHGGMADSHLAFPVELSAIQENFEKALKKTLDIFRTLRISPIIKQRAYAPGSFQLRFNLSFDVYNELFIKQELLYHTIADILKELIPTDENQLHTDKELEKFTNNNKLISEIQNVFQAGGIIYNEKSIASTKQKFREIVNHYADMASGMGHGYNEIELLAERRESKDLIPLNLIDSYTTDNLNRIVEVIESISHEILKDEDFKLYMVCIYSLNTESRVGKALIYNRNDAQIMDKVSIKISGSEFLEKTIFTESLHLNKWIQVHAMATLKDGKYSKLTIRGE